MPSYLTEQKVQQRLAPLHHPTVQRQVSRPLELAMAGARGWLMGLFLALIDRRPVTIATICGTRFIGPSSTFLGMMATLICYLGSTLVNPSSGVHGHWRLNRCGWHLCTWMVPSLNGTTPWSVNMASCRGLASQSLLIFDLDH
jgi:hypothetical protein